MKSRNLWLFLSLLMVLALVACAKATPTPTPTPTPAATPRITPPTTPTATPVATPAARKPEGTLVVGISALGLAATGIPSRADAPGAYILLNSNETLLRRDTKGNLVPGLAEKWELSPDSKKLTVYLRKGVQFHDNWGELTAEDVKFSWADAVKQGSVNIGVGNMQQAESVEAIDQYTVVFNLKPGKSIIMPYDLGTTPTPRLNIVSKKYVESVGLEKAAAKPIGTGPWKFVEFKAGDSVKYEAVENHWRQTPYFKTLIIREVPEPATVAAMLRAGDVDVAPIPIAFKAELEKGGVKIITPGGGYSSYVNLGGMVLPTRKTFDPTIPWVEDPKDPQSVARALKVRKAMNLAVNRQEIVNTILGGLGKPVVTPCFFPDTPWYDPSWQIPYDPAQAKKLLEEAGYPKGFEVEMQLFAMGGRPWMPDVGEAVSMFWEQNLGLKVNRKVSDYSTLRPMAVARTVGQRTWAYGCGVYGEPWMFFESSGMRSSADALIGAESLEGEAMLDQIGAELDYNKRVALVRQFGQWMRDTYLQVPIGTIPPLVALGSKVADFPVPFAALSLWEFEYVTPAKR